MELDIADLNFKFSEFLDDSEQNPFSSEKMSKNFSCSNDKNYYENYSEKVENRCIK